MKKKDFSNLFEFLFYFVFILGLLAFFIPLFANHGSSVLMGAKILNGSYYMWGKNEYVQVSRTWFIISASGSIVWPVLLFLEIIWTNLCCRNKSPEETPHLPQWAARLSRVYKDKSRKKENDLLPLWGVWLIIPVGGIILMAFEIPCIWHLLTALFRQ